MDESPDDFDDPVDVTICGELGDAWRWEPPAEDFGSGSGSGHDLVAIDPGSCDAISLALSMPPPAPVPAGAKSLSSIVVTPMLGALGMPESVSGESRRRSARLSQLLSAIQSESVSVTIRGDASFLSCEAPDPESASFMASDDEVATLLDPAPTPTPLPVSPGSTSRSQSEWLTWSIAALTPTVGPEGVADLLAEAMSDAWLRGERTRAEDWLEREPMLQSHPQAAIRLIYEELCLRREDGEVVDLAELARRFPRWRNELAALLAVEGLVPEAQPVSFPEIGSTLGEFQLVAELGRGALGRAFLAVEPALADRPVVVKLTPRDHHVEHLSLARLQHTNIVPLYGVRDFPERNLRALCMPYLGGASLERVLHTLTPIPVERRTGLSLLRALDVAQTGAAVGNSEADAGMANRAARFRKVLAGYDYPEAIALLGSYLAEALHYAHDRGLVHMDVKPSNVLIGDDGQPSLLDFHLARPPIALGDPRPDVLGGTPDYMSPEQREALAAVREGVAPPRPVDGRSDIYSLALVLLEALGGRGHPPLDAARTIRDSNAGVSVGLADILVRCLAEDPEDRYPDAASLAEDLRAHVRGLPLRGVANRSMVERFKKWRTRRQRSDELVLRWLRFLLTLTVLGGAPMVAVRVHDARVALDEAGKLAARGEHRQAAAEYRRGLDLLGPLPFGRGIRADLAEGERLSSVAVRVGAFADVARLLAAELEPGAASDPVQLRKAAAFDRDFQVFWHYRQQLPLRPTPTSPPDPHFAAHEALRRDVLDLVLIQAQVQGLIIPTHPDALSESIAFLDNAVETVGPASALIRLRERLSGLRPASPSPGAPTWEHVASGRDLMLQGDLPGAAVQLDEALAADPGDLWAHLYRAQVARRQSQPTLALSHARAALALRPASKELRALVRLLEG